MRDCPISRIIIGHQLPNEGNVSLSQDSEATVKDKDVKTSGPEGHDLSSHSKVDEEVTHRDSDIWKEGSRQEDDHVEGLNQDDGDFGQPVPFVVESTTKHRWVE